MWYRRAMLRTMLHASFTERAMLLIEAFSQGSYKTAEGRIAGNEMFNISDLHESHHVKILAPLPPHLPIVM